MKRVCLAFFALCIAFGAEAQKNHNFEVSKQLDIFNSLYKELDIYYVDTLEAKAHIEEAINYMLDGLDPYTEYYPESETHSLKEMTTGKYAGIGSAINYKKALDRCIIAEPFEGMPAATTGLKAGDVILSIDGKDVGKKGSQNTEDYVSAVSAKLRGDAGTSFELVVQRPGVEKPLTFKLVRQNVHQPAVPYYGMLTDSIGYICLTGFTENCSREVKQAVINLKKQGALSLVLDLRSNGGGLLNEAVELVNLFIPKGKEVVSMKGKVTEVNATYRTPHEPLDATIPLTVLVDGQTASASEITSGALQDYDRAVIIGERTYGKGLGQQQRELPFNGLLKLTTSKYYIPSGRCIQALDYKHRDAEGEAIRTPDSLTHVFHTTAGREVRDGGGITPDIKIERDSMPTMLAYLQYSDAFFDYVTKYNHEHPSIASASDFVFPDADYPAFKEYIKKSNFTYDRQSLKALDALKRVAKLEGYASSAAPEIKALEAKLTHNEDFDLEHWKVQIKRLLSSEIAERYYYVKGKIQSLLIGDEAVNAAKRILRNPEEYKRIMK